MLGFLKNFYIDFIVIVLVIIFISSELRFIFFILLVLIKYKMGGYVLFVWFKYLLESYCYLGRIENILIE